MNPKKLLRKVAPKKAIRMAEEAYRAGRVGSMQLLSGRPARKLRVIAVTGTNGKTTTCSIINDLLAGAGHKTALFTTAVIEIAGKRELNTSHRTVPLTGELMRFLKKARAADVDFVILEATSHALHQHKLLGIPVEVPVMTNLTQDHLDYHGTMQAYAEAKSRLFSNYLHPKTCVLNADDEWFDFFKKASRGQVVDYGKKASTMKLSHIKLSANGASFDLGWLKLKSPLPGEFNVYNTAAAVTAVRTVGLSDEQIVAGIAKLRPIPGRMQVVEGKKGVTVLVDYAHTPDALENVLKAARGIAKNKVHLVFGATGDRDKAKRPKMGEIAAAGADCIYLTDDETYTENPAAIRAAVMEGIKAAKGGRKTIEIDDRREAIKAALEAANSGDVVLLTGIGHQDYRAMGGKKQPWDEARVAMEIIDEL